MQFVAMATKTSIYIQSIYIIYNHAIHMHIYAYGKGYAMEKFVVRIGIKASAYDALEFALSLDCIEGTEVEQDALLGRIIAMFPNGVRGQWDCYSGQNNAWCEMFLIDGNGDIVDDWAVPMFSLDGGEVEFNGAVYAIELYRTED